MIYPCFPPFLASFCDLGELTALSQARDLPDDSKALIHSSNEVLNAFPIFCFIQIMVELMMQPCFPPFLASFFDVGGTHRPVMGQEPTQCLQGFDIFF
jgi:hypothetical protein